MFAAVLVANRGEIAVRVIRTLHRLGVEAVAVYSDADVDAPHVRAADRAVRLGPAAAGASYLDVERVVEAAVRTGAGAVHPGYGFLSERPELARACRDAGVTFVGPPPEALALLGDKIAAKEVAAGAGVPVVPGSGAGAGSTDAELERWAADQELPLLVKAAGGGGGRGMRVVRALAELPDALAAARREAQAAFGDGRLLVEGYLERPRHLEVQILADRHGHVLHLGERECSLQRRYQKVVEEAPSPVVTPELRARLGAAAVELARRCGYQGAGTVEFVAEADEPSRFYFLEMNARLQVEHPVTEAITGLDLVELQLRIAAGEPLPPAQDWVTCTGNAVEARVYAEDPEHGFVPSAGRIVAYREPGGVRVDTGIGTGIEVTAAYDPLLLKVIAHGPDRDAALARLRRALGELRVVGPETNIAYLGALLDRPEVRAGQFDTGLLERLAGQLAPPPPDPALAGLALIALLGPPASDDPWDAGDGWRLTGPACARARVRSSEAGALEAAVRPDGEGGYLLGDVRAWLDGDVLRVAGEEATRTVDVYRDGDAVWLVDAGVPTRWAWATETAGHQLAAGSLEAPMPGVVLEVRTEAGAAVAEGDVLLVLESMKMELSIVSPSDGVVGDVYVREGDRVAKGAALVSVGVAE